MQPASNRPRHRSAGTSELTSAMNLSEVDAAMANALQERLASGRPMPRSLRRSYELLMVRESIVGRSAE
ncbi:MAG: hypothetical protein AAGG11_09100 [Pseudomonadota bacterium]